MRADLRAAPRNKFRLEALTLDHQLLDASDLIPGDRADLVGLRFQFPDPTASYRTGIGVGPLTLNDRPHAEHQ